MAPDKKIEKQDERVKRIQGKIEADKADEFAKKVAAAKKAGHLSAKALDLYSKALGESKA